MKETWKEVVYKSFGNGIYEVSNLGRVRKAIPAPCGRYAGQKNRVLPIALVDGYPYVWLCANHICKMALVHILVANAFLGPCPLGKEVNHKDGVKVNSKKSNLEYLTRLENVAHAFANGLARRAKGGAHGMAKLTEVEVRRIRKFSKKLSHSVLARRFGVGWTTIDDIVSRRTWRHI